jgi:hypothetical protein
MSTGLTTRHPYRRVGPIPALAALRIDSVPVRVHIIDTLMSGVRIGARYHIHPEFAAARD